MPKEERDGFDNLILLCKPHHTIVDKTEKGRFSIETLCKWKKDREAPGQAALSGLRELTEGRLQELITQSMDSLNERFDEALARFARIDEESASLLRVLKDELAEARLPRVYPDPDVVFMLDRAARILIDLPNTAPALLAAAQDLKGLPDVVLALQRSIRDARGFR